MTTGVSEQYEAYPYPAADPEADDLGAIDVTPSHLLEINHFVFGGRLDLARPLHVLSAGGGTGNAALMMATQMAACGVQGDVVHLDLSATSQGIARRRAERRGLTNLKFVQGSLLDAPGLGLGPFDYVDCSGVLHHLPDPPRGLAALTSVLAPGGGIGLMVYGEYGRTGLYHVQQALALLDRGEPLAERIVLARRLVAALPPNAWLHRNPVLRGDHAAMSDAELVDRYLHPQDRAYTVPQLFQLAAEGDCRPTALVPPARYDPGTYLDGVDLAAAVKPLNPEEKAEMAELLCGDMATHTAYLVRGEEDGHAPPDPASPDAIPVLRRGNAAALATQLKPGMGFTDRLGGMTLEFALTPLSAPIIALIDGQRRLVDIYDALCADRPDLVWHMFLREFDHLYNIMHRHLYRLFLSYVPLPTDISA